MTHRSTDCPAPLTLDTLFLEDPAPGPLERHVAGCVSCQGYLARLREERRAYEESGSRERFLSKLQPRRAAQRSRLLRVWVAAAAVAAALIGVVSWPTEQDDEVRLRGSPFAVFAPDDSQPSRRLSPDDEVATGTPLRFSYSAPDSGFLLILDYDGRGEASVLYPYGAAEGAPVERAGDVLLPGSIVLDDSPRYEWLIAVFSRSRLGSESLLAQLRENPPETAVSLRCGDCEVSALRLVKRP